MRRIALSLIGASLLLQATSALAAGPAAISPYVQATLDRSDRGIQIATDKSNRMQFAEDSLPLWLRQVFSGIATMVDTKSLVVEQGRSLLEDTSCRRYDDLLLELQISRVQTELRAAVDRKSASSVLLLLQVLDFLQERREAIARGADDPGFVDVGWYKHWFFDDRPQYCCNSDNTCTPSTTDACNDSRGQPSDSLAECKAFGCNVSDTAMAGEPAMCPFSSNYLVPSMQGYGCDAEALSNVKSRAVGADFTRFQEVIGPELESLISIQNAVDVSATRQHRAMQGCLSDQDQQVLEQNAVFVPLRGPFSLDIDHVRLLMKFQQLREQEGLERPLPKYLMPDKNLTLLRATAAEEAQKLQALSLTQERKESVTFAIGADPLLSANVSYEKLNDAVYTLGQLASSMSGIRGFVRDFAYYLRRTCMERPCNERLDRVLKIVFEDACFPYTSGEYLNDTAANPRWQTCADAAGFSLP